MKIKIALLSLLLCLGGLPLAAPAQAAIISTTGSLVEIAPPASVDDGDLESDTVSSIFAESNPTLLTSDLTVNFTASGSYSGSINPSATIDMGKLVESYFVHMDHVGTSSATLTYVGSVTFDNEILGVIHSAGKLDTSDPILGLGSVVYPTGNGSVARGSLDSGGSLDTITLSADRKTISFDLAHNADNIEQFRIVTAVPEPSSIALSLLAIVGMIGLVRRRRTV